MGVLNNVLYQKLGKSVEDATNIVCEIIHRLQTIQRYDSVETNIFIELCNDMKHIEILCTHLNWTVGQKRAFLKKLDPFIAQIQENSALRFWGNIDLSRADEEQLDVAIESLKRTLHQYVGECEKTSAIKHATLMGKKVAEELQKIDTKMLTPQDETEQAKQEVQEATSKIFTNLHKYIMLHESASNKGPTIAAFLDAFQQHYNHTPLVDLLRPISVNLARYNKEYSGLQQAVLEVARNKIEDTYSELFQQIVGAEQQARSEVEREHADSVLNGLLTMYLPEETLLRKNLEKQEADFFNALSQQLNIEMQKYKENLENNFAEAISAAEDYIDTIKQYSGTAEEKVVLNEAKVKVETWIQQLSSEKNKKVASQFLSQEPQWLFLKKQFTDHPSAMKYLGDLEKDCLEHCEQSKQQALKLEEAISRAFAWEQDMQAILQQENIDTSDFQERMRTIINDIPHDILEIFKETNKKITAGSSRFF